MIFGLVSLLVVLGIMMIIFKTFEAPSLEQGKKAEDQAEQISGRDASGVPAFKSYTGEEADIGGHFHGIKIDTLSPGGPMETAYGLKAGDVVVKIGDLDVTTLGDYSSGKGQLDQAFQMAAPLTVERDGATTVLPCKGPMGTLLQH